MERRILLTNELGNNIFTRNTISSLINQIEKSKEEKIVFDFKGVRFISRSCADEYIKRKKESNKEFIEENLSNEVRAMFKLVQAQYRSLGISFSTNSNCSLIPA